MFNFTFRWTYFVIACALFLIELFIGLYVHDRIIRPFVGDVLVVLLIYSFAMAFLKVSYRKVALGVFIFACTVEMLQYFKFVDLLGLRKYKVLAIALGSTFDWYDLLAYFLGYCIIMSVEKNRKG